METLTHRSRKRPRVAAWDVKPTTNGNKNDTEAFRLPQRIARRHVSPPLRPDTSDGHYAYEYGDNLTPRYKILSKMGEGTFGRVLECWDRRDCDMVAIKVVRSIRKYRDAAMVEIDILQHLAKNNGGALHCVQIRDWFDYRNHICIVFEKLGPSLFEFLRSNLYRPFPLDLVREFGRQLLESVAYMHDLRLIHTDLKPENILLMSSEVIKLPGHKRNSHDESKVWFLPKSSTIKLIDFGSSVFEKQGHSSIVCTRHYRAPEVILGLGWSYPCDLWSVGCILMELCSVRIILYFPECCKPHHILFFSLFRDSSLVAPFQGRALFQTHENLEHLAMMERVLGPLPRHMIQRASRGAEKYFRRAGLNWPDGAVSRESIRSVKQLDRLKDLVSKYVGESRSSLTDLLYGLLEFDPSERLTARQALQHPFFTSQV